MLDYTSVVITRRVEPSDAVLARAWSFAGQLGQSDVFDSLGYAIAEEIGAEFWTSDLRFSNAAAHARLSSIRYIP